MGSYRDRLEIIADMLKVISQNARKTKIMYQANLSYKVLQKYLGELTAASFIIFKVTEQCYVLTTKGVKFLEAYDDYAKTSKNIEKRLHDVYNKKKTLEELCSNK
jgi:predicted transcriptional regulator